MGDCVEQLVMAGVASFCEQAPCLACSHLEGSAGNDSMQMQHCITDALQHSCYLSRLCVAVTGLSLDSNGSENNGW